VLHLSSLQGLGPYTVLGTMGGTLSLASSANERGMVVGGAFNSVADPWSQGPSSFETNFFFFPGITQAHAFLWDQGAMTDLGTLGGPDSVAAVINNRGQVAGTSFTDSTPNLTTGIPTAHPFLWDGGAMQDIGTFGGTNSLAMNMNDHGQVVGWANVVGDGSHHAFCWRKGLRSGGRHRQDDRTGEQDCCSDGRGEGHDQRHSGRS
jgi:probable HAF family extracellular repeat protein